MFVCPIFVYVYLIRLLSISWREKCALLRFSWTAIGFHGYMSYQSLTNSFLGRRFEIRFRYCSLYCTSRRTFDREMEKRKPLEIGPSFPSNRPAKPSVSHPSCRWDLIVDLQYRCVCLLRGVSIFGPRMHDWKNTFVLFEDKLNVWRIERERVLICGDREWNKMSFNKRCMYVLNTLLKFP